MTTAPADRCPSTGKVRHPSPQHAHRAVTHQERREHGGRRSSSAAAYRCDDCTAWHVRTENRRPGLRPDSRDRNRRPSRGRRR